jgi:hypothetical protein
VGKDKSLPNIEVVKELAGILDITVDELVSASIDYKKADEKRQAKNFRVIRNTYNLILFIGFGVALLTCFIVNLAVSHTLSWFFIVFTALILSSTLLIIPQYIKKNRLLLVPLLFMGSLFVLLAVVSLYTHGGGWLFVASFAILLAYTVIFLPILIKYKDFPQVIKQHNALFSIGADAAALILLLAVTNIYTGGGFWFGTVALPIAAVCLLPILATVFVLQYLFINWEYKTAFLIAVWTIFFNIINPYISLFARGNNGGCFWKANFTEWNSAEMINNNVYAIISAAATITAICFVITGLLRQKLKK